MAAPINVALASPTITVPDWSQQAAEWKQLNQRVGGNPDFYPLTIKAGYVLGIIHNLAQSVTILLEHPNTWRATYIPACGIFASGVELLGRCINGNSGTSNTTRDLETGFKYLESSNHQTIPNSHVLVTAGSGAAYSVDMLVALRHFAAHGQATMKHSLPVDYDLLSRLSPRFAGGLGRYWNELQTSVDRCNQLALANIIAFRNWPVRLIWELLERDEHGRYKSVEEIFGRFTWEAPTQ